MPQRRISIVAAVARNGVIGAGGRLPWHLPEDLAHFRALTMGHHIVMGRKTFESLGRLLPGRISVIVSRDAAYAVPGAIVAHSLQQAVARCGMDEEIFVIGGAQIYQEALVIANRIYLTEIQADFTGDTVFPPLDRRVWHEVAREDHVSAQGIAFSYVTLEKQETHLDG